jgi:homoserine O-acetyltransferase
MAFPSYNGRDMIRAQHKLITEGLGISHLLAVTGISSGADHSVQYAVSYPDFMDGIFPIVGGTPFTTQGRLIGSWMMSIIESCKGWDGGNYEENPKGCASNALSVLIPYFYTRDWWETDVDTPEAYTKWRDNWGDYYLDVQERVTCTTEKWPRDEGGSAIHRGSTVIWAPRCAPSRPKRYSSLTHRTNSFHRNTSMRMSS